ncbi:MAG: hypothetical protein PHE21_04200 [Candidatus Dojkabacteria bacterium]|nr:hypothetical protein [Candidatus Dojkabacteria bacterium]
MTPDQYPYSQAQNPSDVPMSNINQPQNFNEPPVAEATNEPLASQQGAEIPNPWANQQSQQNLESQTPQQPSETDDPLGYIRENTPSNDTPNVAMQAEIPSQEPTVEPNPVTPTSSYQPEIAPEAPLATPESREKEQSLQEQLNSVKEMLSLVLEDKKVKDFTNYPMEMVNPEIYTPEDSTREMIKPFGIMTVRFGYPEFKKALENPLALNEDTYILKYLSGRIRKDGSSPEPKFYKCTKEQVNKWRAEIERVERNKASHTSLNAY